MNITSQKLIALTTWSWYEAPTGYLPSDGYTAFKINFFKDSTNKFTITGVADVPNDHWDIDLASNLNIKASGLYQWQAIATKDGLDYVVASGTITIYPNLASETDPRGTWTRIYENLVDAYEQLSTKQAQTVNLYDGTQVTLLDLTDLENRIQRAKTEMEKEIGKTKLRRRIAVFR